jgi:DNA-binding CsgD family transcriptional regulator
VDSFQSLSPQLIVVLLVGLGLILWFISRRFNSSRNPQHRSKTFSVHIIDETSPLPSSKRRWQWDSLTPREMEVAQLAAQGKRNSEIARDLHISVRTVETHLANIYAKLNVRSRAELGHLIRDLVD